MLIPSIDLMGGRIVQLVQGERKALEFDDFDPWIERFTKFSLVQLIDLDAAIGTGSNRALLERFTRRLTCHVGGGIRDAATARQILELGVRAVIIGSALVKDGKVNTAFAEEVAGAVGADRLVFAVDSKRGHVATHGWRQSTPLTAEEMMRELDPWCSGFLYTHVDTEGLMVGIPLDVIKKLRLATKNKLMAAGGINSLDQVAELDRMGVDAVVGMAIYTGRIDV
jgi:phosphoribosylformimino-5-aminoimidazole carboxamide ribotide isomerase